MFAGASIPVGVSTSNLPKPVAHSFAWNEAAPDTSLLEHAFSTRQMLRDFKNIVELTPGELGEQAQLVKAYNVAVSMAQLLERDASEMHEVTQLDTLLD
jgi:hypothetical protein